MKDYDVRCCSPEFWAFLVICVVLVAFAGINSGLALGLLSFGPVDLEVLLKAGQPQERKYAAKILPLVSNEHLLLCALLVGKSLAMEALPLFLDSILPTWAAILVSVTLVLSFTEILPQAICSRYGLSLGAKMSVLVRVLLLIFLPVAYPISKAGKGGELSHHETSIIRGALDLTQKTAKDAMTPISETFSLDINSKLDVQTMGLIMSKGHSRVPVYTGQPTNIVGLILVKNLISCRPEDQTPIKFMTIRKIPRVQENWPLYDILALFQKGHSHMAIVHRSNQDDRKTENSKPSPDEDTTCEAKPATMSPLHPHEYSISLLESPVYSTDSDFPSLQLKDVTEQYENLPSPLKKVEKINPPLPLEGLESLPCNLDEEVVGIITMEDIMEELLQKEILDETDEYVDLHNRIRINLALSRGSSRSPRSEARFNRITPDQSQLSTRAVMLRSPIAPYIQPPLPKPILYTSPVSKRIASSGTPLSHKVRVQKLHSNTSALS
ncbi:hypothetical protein MLD38_029150 [Melastoma candidum]|uniref:Uncharacterized protein n=1 Tax=Melastoma candidum TaxID=119954 RepID=A0ACB9N2W6_9MYRT|nr:hypothetical protein MLD38_029150 [Melastoma candidum]